MPGFPGGAVVGSPPASAGDAGSSPGPGGSHMAAEQLSPCTTTAEASAPGARAPQQEKPPQWVAPARRNWRKPTGSNEDPNAAKNK